MTISRIAGSTIGIQQYQDHYQETLDKDLEVYQDRGTVTTAFHCHVIETAHATIPRLKANSALDVTAKTYSYMKTSAQCLYVR